MNSTNVRSEGGLLPADFLSQIRDGAQDIPGLDASSYGLVVGERLSEPINRSWSRLQGVWASFQRARETLPEADRGTTLSRERWLLALFQELGFGRLPVTRSLKAAGKDFAISHLWNSIPIHLVGFRIDLDKRTPGVSGAAASSPHGLVQEFLNRSDSHIWGIVSNGLRLRLVRDNVSLTRQAHIEFDLEAIMDAALFSDFSLLWLLAHESRFRADKPEDCWIEKWCREARERGTRALDGLRSNVETAIEVLGQGFLREGLNGNLKEKLRSGALTPQDYYRELLRLVYRLIFLLVAEERDLLFSSATENTARDRYANNYSIHRLKTLSLRLRGTPHTDLYRSVLAVVGRLGHAPGCPELGLAPLGSFLWSNDAAPNIGNADLRNVDLLAAIKRLCFFVEEKVLRPVDFRNLGAEELGSVYEALLELHPKIEIEASRFTLMTAAGHERKTTGSYYTHSSLIKCLLDSALDPVIQQALIKPSPEQAILDLKVCDPACGSGHFLIAAAHRMAKHLATVRSGDVEPSPAMQRRALRDVIGRCIYGVDINPMSVELCKVSLWLESMEPGKPLSFLENKIRCGNSLIGTTPKSIRDGIPDEAFLPAEGDDKRYCSELKKRNKEERRGQMSLDLEGERAPWDSLGNLASAMRDLSSVGDETIESVEQKNARYDSLVRSSDYLFGHLLADAWCSSFIWKKNQTENSFPPFTEETFRKIETSPFHIDRSTQDEIRQLAATYQFFHWHLEFPDVFIPSNDPGKRWDGGFSCVIGNPPWDRISLKEREFFSGKDDSIASDTNSQTRAQKIAALRTSDPVLFRKFEDARDRALRTKHFLANSGRFPLSAVGDVNTYALFVDLYDQLADENGVCGVITQTQLVTEKTYAGLTKRLLREGRIKSCISFENERMLFPGAHHSTRFVLMTLARNCQTISCASAIWDTAWLSDDIRRYTVDVEDVQRFNPDTWSIPQFRARTDAEIAAKIYAAVPLLGAEVGSRRLTSVSRVMHDKDDADVLSWDAMESIRLGRLPLLESKLLEHYNHRNATYEDVSLEDVRAGYPRESSIEELKNPKFSIRPRKWVSEENTPERFRSFTRSWVLHVRKIANNIMFRTITAAITPKHPNNGSAAWIRNDSFEAADYLFLLGVLNSFVFDYLARQKIGGLNVNSYHLMQLPVPYFPSEQNKEWHVPVILRVFELSYCSHDLAGLATDLGREINEPVFMTKAPFIWDENRREILRAEVDALVALAFGLNRSELDWILDAQHPSESFRVLRDAELSKYGEFRTKRLVLSAYDELAATSNLVADHQGNLRLPISDSNSFHQRGSGQGQRKPIENGKTPIGSVQVVSPVKPEPHEKWKTCVPMGDLKAAAGDFGEQQTPGFKKWVQIRTGRPLKKGMFVAEVRGRSMEPTIPAGSYCLFLRQTPKPKSNSIWIFERSAETDPEEGGQYTIKRFKQLVGEDSFGERTVLTKLVPDNPAYPTLDVRDETVRPIAEFLEVLQPLAQSTRSDDNGQLFPDANPGGDYHGQS